MKIVNAIILTILISFSGRQISDHFIHADVEDNPVEVFKKQESNPSHFVNENQQDPIVVKWEELIDINYKVRYFESLDMDISAPVFGQAQKSLDGKEVIITGFVIPFDENMKYLSLSANPYASCFFCGGASAASVISMYMKDGTKRYEIDDFKTFKGTLHLNYDDPNEFIYILKNAVEVN
jgi:hypothetical protein